MSKQDENSIVCFPKIRNDCGVFPLSNWIRQWIITPYHERSHDSSLLVEVVHTSATFDQTAWWWCGTNLDQGRDNNNKMYLKKKENYTLGWDLWPWNEKHSTHFFLPLSFLLLLLSFFSSCVLWLSPTAITNGLSWRKVNYARQKKKIFSHQPVLLVRVPRADIELFRPQ